MTAITVLGPMLLIVIFLFLSSIKILRPTQRGAIETLGKYSKFAEPGLHFVFPLAQRMIAVNVTERMAVIEPQEIITQNRLNAKVDLVVYYKVASDEESIKKSLYNVQNFKSQIIMLAKTTARNVIGELIFEDVNSKRDELNRKLQKVLDVESKSWGVDVVRVELKEILPPQDVQETMNSVIKAENKKTAAKDFAEATETEADGKRRAQIKISEGEKQGAILSAQGKAQAFDLINRSFVGNAQLLKKLEVTENSLKNNAKILITEKGISPQLILGDIPIKSN